MQTAKVRYDYTQNQLNAFGEASLNQKIVVRITPTVQIANKFVGEIKFMQIINDKSVEISNRIMDSRYLMKDFQNYKSRFQITANQSKVILQKFHHY